MGRWCSTVAPRGVAQYFPSADLKSTATLMASPREAGRDGGTPSLPSFVL